MDALGLHVEHRRWIHGDPNLASDVLGEAPLGRRFGRLNCIAEPSVFCERAQIGKARRVAAPSWPDHLVDGLRERRVCRLEPTADAYPVRHAQEAVRP